jgi:hypothetical protein
MIMKTFKYIPLFTMLLIVASCQTNASAPIQTARITDIERGSLAIETITLKKSVLLSEDLGENSPRLSISLSLLDITGFTTLQKNFQDIFYQGLSPADYAATVTGTITMKYHALRDAEYQGQPQEFMNWVYSETIGLYAKTSSALVVSLDREYYTGGAHGMTERNYFVFDLGNGNRLLLADILEDGAMPSLQKLAEGELRTAMNIPAQLPLMEKGFFSNTLDILYDFYINSSGIGIQWDPYEIAPYVMGAMEILIPARSAKGFLNVKGLALLKDFS